MGDRQARADSGRKSIRALRKGLINNFKNSGIEVYTPSGAELGVWKSKTKSVHGAFTAKYGKSFFNSLKKHF
jgi:hypothetical protein